MRHLWFYLRWHHILSDINGDKIKLAGRWRVLVPGFTNRHFSKKTINSYLITITVLNYLNFCYMQRKFVFAWVSSVTKISYFRGALLYNRGQLSIMSRLTISLNNNFTQLVKILSRMFEDVSHHNCERISLCSANPPISKERLLSKWGENAVKGWRDERDVLRKFRRVSCSLRGGHGDKYETSWKAKVSRTLLKLLAQIDFVTCLSGGVPFPAAIAKSLMFIDPLIVGFKVQSFSHSINNSTMSNHKQ